MDWNGNLVWECPYGVTIEAFTIKLLFGLSHIMLEFIPKPSGTTPEYLSNMLTGKAFNYDCRHPGLFIDSYTEYVLKEKEYDIEMRRIQSEKQEVQAWFNVAENVGFGAAFGQGKGAAAAGIGGVIEAAGTWVINQEYDPKIQAQYDKKYARMTDQVSLVGDSVTNLFYFAPFYIYQLTMDSASATNMCNDISENGYMCNEMTNNLSNMFTYQEVNDSYIGTTVKPVYQADSVVVEGACNVIGKQQVVRRLQNGVEFI